MVWWLWIIIGIALFISELFLPLDFFLVIIGLGFATTGALVSLDIFSESWQQWSTCAVVSLAYLAGIRPVLIARIRKGETERPADYIGELVTPKEDIAPGKIGKGSLRGTSWQIRNASQQPLKADESYPVAKVDGITLVIE